MISFVVLLFVTTACEKDSEIYDTPTTEKPILRFSKTASEISSEFFNPYFAANQNPNINSTTTIDDQIVNNNLLQEVLLKLSSQNDVKEFTTKTTELIGYPIWNKSFIHADVVNNIPVSLVLTPFTFPNNRNVSAVLATIKDGHDFSFNVFHRGTDCFLTYAPNIPQLNLPNSYNDYVNSRKKIYKAFDKTVFDPSMNGVEIASSINMIPINFANEFINDSNGGVLFDFDTLEDVDDGSGAAGNDSCDCEMFGDKGLNMGNPQQGGGSNNSGGGNNNGGGSNGYYGGSGYYGTYGAVYGGGLIIYTPSGNQGNNSGGGGSHWDGDVEIESADFFSWDDFEEYFDNEIEETEVTIALNLIGGLFANIDTDCEPLSEDAFDLSLMMLLDALQEEFPDIDIPTIGDLGNTSGAEMGYDAGEYIPTAAIVLQLLNNHLSSEEMSSVVASLDNVTGGIADEFEAINSICESRGSGSIANTSELYHEYLLATSPEYAEFNAAFATMPPFLVEILKELLAEATIDYAKKHLKITIADDVMESIRNFAAGNYRDFVTGIGMIVFENSPHTKGAVAIWKASTVGRKAYSVFSKFKEMAETLGEAIVSKLYKALNKNFSFIENMKWGEIGIELKGINLKEVFDDLAEDFGIGASLDDGGNGGIYIQIGDIFINWYPVSGTTGGPTIAIYKCNILGCSDPPPSNNMSVLYKFRQM